MSDQSREKNSNWRGGRTVASHGYVLIRVGMTHPMADCRGYAYEHRLVASEALGRPLLRTEEVHHIDGNKANNNPSNLMIHINRAAHFAEHRHPGSRLRRLGEGNPLIACECGCGTTLSKYDNYGRPRRFISGHNMRLRHG